MAIFYKRVERGKPGVAGSPKRFYPLLKSTGMVREREVAKQLADETTLNPKEAEMAISQTFKVISNLLLNGKTVQIGDLGSFRLTATTEGSDTMQEVTAAKIKKLNVRFTESAELKNAMKKAKFVDASTMS